MIKINFIFLCLTLSFAIAEDKGLSHFKKGEFDKAIQYYESTLAKGGAADKAHFGIGTSALSQGNVEMAMDAFERALNSEDDALKAKAYYNMGNTLFNMKRNEESLAFYRKALELNPNDTDAKYNYEMVRYNPQENQEQQENQNSKKNEDQEKQDQQKQDSEKQEKGEQQKNPNNSEDDLKQDEEEQKENESQNDEQNQEENSEEQSSAKQDETSSQEKEDLRNAERILDALKEDEKILQKRQMSRVKSRKLEKDW